MNECLHRNVAVRRYAAKTQTGLNRNVTYLCHFDGSLEDSGFNKSPIGNVTATYDTVNYKFGGSSLAKLSGSILINAANKYFGKRWTIDFWIYASQYILPTKTFFYSGIQGVIPYYRLSRPEVSTTDPPMQGLVFSFSEQGSPLKTLRVGDFPLNIWSHYAITCDGTMVRTFYNGVMTGSAAVTVNFDNFTIASIGDPAVSLNPPLYQYDEFRYLRNECAWMSNFTPPTAPYTGKERYLV